jgi:hypothetical protein
MSIWIKKNNSKELGSKKLNNKYNKIYGTSEEDNAGVAIIHKI